ncbi:helix-turn-helix domain-containing protein [Lactobacillus sp. AN1001]|uniref:MerR family transcriptional regulator n=1 Tax=Ligilactobacillus animalis TaxID=1605 RepID=UPI00242D3A4D|nr:helix-turn-helix domain-containing protein [Ligilactobacillus animalis]MCI5941952.1 helix-turn-helix domain-containing protein [Ligilactobacillus animalis]MDY2993095.1 helix-turn-helix domain-containing protein [Ligilactobacillus animalis]
MQRLSIGEMSKLSNVSIQTLRYYDQIGLFKPAFVDNSSGYRYYNIDQLFYLDIVKYLRHLELPLKQIKQIVALPPAQLNEILENRSSLIDAKIAQLLEIKQALKHQQQQITTQLKQATRPLGQVYRSHEAKQLLLQKNSPTDLTPLAKPDKEVRLLTQQLERSQAVASLQYGFVFPLKDYRSLSRITYSKLVMPVYRKLELDPEFELFELPATDWLAISFKWSTTTYLEHYQKLLAAYQKEFKILTDQIDVYEISVPTTYSVTGNSEFITELKIPLYHR